MTQNISANASKLNLDLLQENTRNPEIFKVLFYCELSGKSKQNGSKIAITTVQLTLFSCIVRETKTMLFLSLIFSRF